MLNAVGICCKTMYIGLLINILAAHCEFYSLIFLFISETKEAFFNKTTENVRSVSVTYSVSSEPLELFGAQANSFS